MVDASAVLAYLQNEPGSSRVGPCLDRAVMSSVNLCEVIQKAKQRGAEIAGFDEDLIELGIRIEPFSVQHALIAADLWQTIQTTRASGLSLADRACLALAVEQNAPVLTADRAWGEITLPAVVEVIR